MKNKIAKKDSRRWVIAYQSIRRLKNVVSDALRGYRYASDSPLLSDLLKASPEHIADEKIFDLIPLKKEVKATISGIYITDVRGVRGPLEQPKPKEKFFQRMKNKIAKKDK